MAQKKISVKEKALEMKAKEPAIIKLVKLNSLSKAEIAKINFDEIWLMKPSAGVKKAKVRYCRCRNVCIV